jgi:arylformamidase
MALLLLLLGTAARAQPPLPAQAAIAYGADPAQTLDLRTPAKPGPHRLVVFLHGGGWTAGTKAVGGRIAPPLLQAGYAVASVEYRKVPQTGPAGALSDAAHAVAYLLAHARQYDLYPDRFALLGHSSGAHMVALLATDPAYLRNAGVDPAHLAAAITLDGVFNVTANLTNYPSEQRFAAFGNDPVTWKHYSPTDLLATSGMHPQFCVLHEDRNQRFVEQAGLFEAALRRANTPFSSTIVHGYKHGQLAQQFADPNTPMAPFVLGCLGHALPAT